MVGPAVLYTPRAFADAGYLFALIALAASTALFLYSSQRLLDCWKYIVITTGNQHQELQQQQEETHHQSKDSLADEIELVSLNNNNYKASPKSKRFEKSHVDSDDDNENNDGTTKEPDGIHRHDDHTTNNNAATRTRTTTTAVTYPELARMAHGEVGEMAVRTGICLMQLGICLTYFIFVPHNLTVSMYKLLGVRLPLWFNLIVMVVIEIPLCWIRDIRKLVYTNVAANVLISFGLASSLYLALFVANNNTAVDTTFSNDMNVTLVSPPDLSEVAATTTTRSHLSPWNDQWYLFIGTSVGSR